MLTYTIVVYAVSCVGLATNIHALDARQESAIADTFNIYAYGESISGLPVFYADGRAELGDAVLLRAAVAQPVYFTVSDTSRDAWIAYPNTTEINEAPFGSAVLSLSPTESADGAVEFLQPSAEVIAANSVFDIYGNYVLALRENVNFYAVPTEADGVYSLIWSDVASEHIRVTLRTIAPATDAVLQNEPV